MPAIEYKCQSCGKVYTLITGVIRDELPETCECGGKWERDVSSANIRMTPLGSMSRTGD